MDNMNSKFQKNQGVFIVQYNDEYGKTINISKSETTQNEMMFQVIYLSLNAILTQLLLEEMIVSYHITKSRRQYT